MKTGLKALVVIAAGFTVMHTPARNANAAEVGAVMREHNPRVALVYVHFPLSMHRFALPAARAAECAAAQGRFRAFHDALFDGQDSLGLKAWVSFAGDAEVADTAEFDRCVHKTGDIPLVQSGVTAGKRLGIRGTPTVLINGWELSAPPTSSHQLDSLIAVLAHAPTPK